MNCCWNDKVTRVKSRVIGNALLTLQPSAFRILFSMSISIFAASRYFSTLRIILTATRSPGFEMFVILKLELSATFIAVLNSEKDNHKILYTWIKHMFLR